MYTGRKVSRSINLRDTLVNKTRPKCYNYDFRVTHHFPLWNW